MLTIVPDHVEAETILYLWVCDKITTRAASVMLHGMGYTFDFNQEPDDNKFIAQYRGATLTLEV